MFCVDLRMEDKTLFNIVPFYLAVANEMNRVELVTFWRFFDILNIFML